MRSARAVTWSASPRNAPAEPRVLGGSQTSSEQAPWIVAVTDDAGHQFCGGALISPIKVVTAAHCAIDPASGVRRSPAGLRAVTGRADLNTQDGEVAEVEQVWVHPEYKGFARGHDVAVLTLRAPVQRPSVSLVGQGDPVPYQPGTVGRVYGWGRTTESGQNSPVLRSAEVPVADDATCGRAYGGFDAGTMFCAGAPEGGRDACAGDSGGPFVVGDRLVGVVSFGTGCGRPDSPGVYTRLAAVADAVAGA